MDEDVRRELDRLHLRTEGLDANGSRGVLQVTELVKDIAGLGAGLPAW